MFRVYIVFAVLICQVEFVSMATFSQVKTLYDFLTTNRNIYLRPQTDYDQATAVSVSFTLLNLQGIDAVAGTVCIAGYFTVMWTDENLVWTPGSYNNIDLITIPHNQIWKPPLINMNSAGEMKVFGRDNTFVTLYSNGSAIWQPGEDLEFVCDIDTTYFPFDKQTCTLKVITWGFPMGKITFQLTDTVVNTALYSENSEWELSSTSVSTDSTMMPMVLFTMNFDRRPLFLLVTLTLPAIFMAILNIFVYLLPHESGERIGFAITLLLAIVVFLTIAQGILPATATPRLSAIYVLLMFDLIQSTVIVVSVIIGSWFYYQPEDKEVPLWIQKIVRIKLPWCRKSSNEVHELDWKVTAKQQEVMSQKEEKSDDLVTWQTVSHFWDKFSLIACIVMQIAGNMYYFIDISRS